MTDHEGQEQDDEEDEHAPRHLSLVAGTVAPEVDEDDPDAVEGVEEDRGDEPDLHQPDDRVLVRLDRRVVGLGGDPDRSEEHTSELQSLMRISYAFFCLK